MVSKHGCNRLGSMLPMIIPSIHIHEKEERLFIWCGNNREAKQMVRMIPKAKWSQARKQWHFELKREVITCLLEKASGYSETRKCTRVAA